MKTIKEIADSLNLNKQKVYRYVKANYINEVHQENGVIYVNDTVETAIIEHFTESTTSSEVHHEHIKSTSNDTLLDTLQRTINTLTEQLAVKDEQLKSANSQIDTLTKLLDQQQQLQAMTTKKDSLPEPESRKRFLSIFKRHNQ